MACGACKSRFHTAAQRDVRNFPAAFAGSAPREKLIEDSVLQKSPRIPGRYYFAIFVLACATLSYQILITRFFSVMLYYHFAFAAISLAMLGLTRGAMQVYGNPDRYAPRTRKREFARHASWFAISGVGAMIAFLCVPLVIPADYVLVALAIATFAFVMPSPKAASASRCCSRACPMAADGFMRPTLQGRHSDASGSSSSCSRSIR